jgi:hypothetical protein
MQAVSEHKDALASTHWSGKLPKTLAMRTNISLPLLESQHHRSNLAKLESGDLQRVEDLIRHRSKNPKAILEDLHLKPFFDVCPVLP